MAARNPTFRERALEVALAEAAAGVHEIGGNNLGPIVATFLRSAGINVPAAWCMAFVHWCYLRVGLSLGGGASVGFFQEWGRQNGDLVTRPLRGDVGCWDYTGDHWADHVFIVERVLALGPFGWVLSTVEGNTGSDANAGLPDGVYRRTRRIGRGQLVFVRIPGQPNPAKEAAARAARKPHVVYTLIRREHAGWWMTTIEPVKEVT